MPTQTRMIVGLLATPALLLTALLSGARADDGLFSIFSRLRGHRHQHHDGQWASGETCQHCSSPVVVHEGKEYEMTGNRFIDWWKTLSMKVRGRTMRRYYQTKAKFWKPDRWNPRDWENDDSCEACSENGAHSKRLWMQKRLQRARCKYGYFLPTGCCGAGCPAMGKYDMVYSANPDYFDPRDGQVYAAPGYGVPMAVPLAPNVDKTYNYGWGIPSSRLTPISRRVPANGR